MAQVSMNHWGALITFNTVVVSNACGVNLNRTFWKKEAIDSKLSPNDDSWVWVRFS